MVPRLFAKEVETMVLEFFKKLLDDNEREIKKLSHTVELVNELEQGIQKLSDSELAARTGEFQERLKNGEDLDDILPEAFAVVRYRGGYGYAHFDVQIIGHCASPGSYSGDEDRGA